MNDTWMKMKPRPHYKHCGLTRNKDVYFDCPAPAVHRARQLSNALCPPDFPSSHPSSTLASVNSCQGVLAIGTQCSLS